MGLPHGGGRAAYAEGPPHESLREEGADLQGFVPAHAHQFLVEVYGHHLHPNNGTNLDGGVVDDAIWKL